MTLNRATFIQYLSREGLERLPDAVIWIDERGAILHVNETAVKMYGFSRAEFIHLSVFDLNPNMKLEAWDKHWRKDRQSPQQIETSHQKANGEMFPVEIANNWEEIEGILYSCSIIRDISQRRAKEAQFQKLYRQIQHRSRDAKLSLFTLDRTEDAVFWTCPSGYIKFTNEAACARLGYTREEMHESSIKMINHNIDQNKLEQLWTRLRKEHSFIFESIHHRKDGSTLPVEINANYIEFEGMEYACSIARDISERKAKEAALQKAMQELKSLKDKLEAENQYLQSEIASQRASGSIISQSQEFQKALNKLQQVAPTDSTVLILGESGTGKELIAKEVHRLSRRKKESLIKINCAALPENLIESELFGHEKGAFTGAHQRKIGKFELAHGGTLFLDEIGELPLILQAKLLRVLQEGEIERVGGNKTIEVDVRIVAATNRNLQTMVQQGGFRNDLYFRLFVFPVELPPLRDRKGDIPLLVQHFCQKFAQKMGKPMPNISKGLIRKLQSYTFPGNVRELENIVERAVIMSNGGQLEIGDWFNDEPTSTDVKLEILSFDEMQKRYLKMVLEHCEWKVSGAGGAAEILQINPSTLASRIRKLGIQRSKEAL